MGNIVTNVGISVSCRALIVQSSFSRMPVMIVSSSAVRGGQIAAGGAIM